MTNDVEEWDVEKLLLTKFAYELRRAFPQDGTRLSILDVAPLIKKDEALRAAFMACDSGHRGPNLYTVSTTMRQIERVIFDGNPPFKFIRKRGADNIWRWGFE
jgi:hypothetical protein